MQLGEVVAKGCSFLCDIVCSGRMDGLDTQLLYRGGNKTLHLEKAPLGHAPKSKEEHFLSSMMLETGKEVVK